ncbi:ROK family protein [Corynebacterium sp. Marseille-Q2516]
MMPRPGQLTAALDLGATKIAYGLISDATPRHPRAAATLPTQPTGHSPQEQVRTALDRLRASLRDGETIARVGIGAPGVVLAPEGYVAHAGPTLPGWAGTNLTELVREHGIDAPVACANDVRVWGFGEHHLGAGRELPDGTALYVSLGTGVGGAFLCAGELAASPTGTAGEISEIICADYQGKAARAEDVASGPGLARYHNAARGLSGPHQPSLRDIIAVLDRTRQDPRIDAPLAAAIIDGNLRGLGRALAGLVSGLDMVGVVIGGGVGSIGPRILEPLRAGFASGLLAPNAKVQVHASALGSHAPLVAAAEFARRCCA